MFVALVLVAGVPTWATVLDFNIAGIANTDLMQNSGSASNFYGDQVGSSGVRTDWITDIWGAWKELDSTYAEGDTPNIETLWSGAGTGFWDTGYGDLSGIVYYSDAAGGGAWPVGFQPQAGFGVVIESFDVAYYGSDVHADIMIETYLAGTNTLVSTDTIATGVTISGATATHTNIPVNFTGTDATMEYWIAVMMSDGTASSLGFDNIHFSQVPEPTTMALLALGGLRLIRRRRRA